MRSGAKLMDPSASRIVTSTVRAGFEGSPGVPAEKVLCLCPGSPVPAQTKVGSSANPNIAIIRIVAPLFMHHLHSGHRARLDGTKRRDTNLAAKRDWRTMICIV